MSKFSGFNLLRSGGKGLPSGSGIKAVSGLIEERKKRRALKRKSA